MAENGKQALRTFIYPLAVLSGTIVGVGFFSLPYIASKVGLWVMLGYFLILGSIVILIHLIFGELAVRTPDYKRLPGFAKIYLGNTGKAIAVISTILGAFGAILAYLIVGGEFLRGLLSPIFGGNSAFYTLFYFVAGAFLIYSGIKIIAKIELLSVILFFLALIAIFFRGQHLLNIENLFLKPNLAFLFLPYGPILFSLWGAALIPEVEEMLGARKDLLKKIIPLSIVIAIIIYLVFIYLVTGITGSQTTESALGGLRTFLGNGIVSIALIFGVLTTFTSFIALGLTLRNVFWYDLKINKNLAFIITCFIPLALFFSGIQSFIPVISVVGGIMLAVDGILILLMYQKIKRSFYIYPLILIFFLGIIYEIIYFVKKWPGFIF